MGSASSKWFSCRGGEDHPVLMVGLSGAGKTTLLKNRLWPRQRHVIGTSNIQYKPWPDRTGGTAVQGTTPTRHLQVETAQWRNLLLTCFDVGGQQKICQLWRPYVAETAGVIFVVDSSSMSDERRLAEAAKELHTLFFLHEDLVGVPVLVVANKQDLVHQQEVVTTSSSQQDLLTQALKLDQLSNPWLVQKCSAVSRGDPTCFRKGLEWLSHSITATRTQPPSASTFSAES